MLLVEILRKVLTKLTKYSLVISSRLLDRNIYSDKHSLLHKPVTRELVATFYTVAENGMTAA